MGHWRKNIKQSCMGKGQKATMLVCGAKDVGKSKFINTIMDYDWRMSLGGYNMEFTEMRNIDGTHRETSDEAYRVDPAMTLFELASHVKLREKNVIAGIVLVHHIIDDPVDTYTVDGWETLFDILGEENMRHLTIVTTKWNEVDPESGWKREQQLVEKFWRTALQQGAQLRRWYSTRFGDEHRDGAIAIVEELSRNGPVVPRLAQELGLEGRKLLDTTAGGKVMNHMRSRIEETEVEKQALYQRAGEGRADGREDIFDEAVEEAKVKVRYQGKLTHGIECLVGKKRFVEPWYKQQGGASPGMLGAMNAASTLAVIF